MGLVKDGAIPLYYQLKVWVLEQIENGVYAPGDQIPTELELCEYFDLSRGTVRQAIKELIADGYLYLVRGRGTFVAERRRDNWSLVDLVSVAEAFDSKGIPFETPVLEVSSQVADAYLSTRLQIEKGEGVVYIKRFRNVENEPIVIFTSYLPEKLASGLYTVDLNNKSLYKLLEEICGIRVAYMDHTISVRQASGEEAGLLRIPEGSPVLFFDELAYDVDNRPVEYSQSTYRGDKSRFFVRSERLAGSKPGGRTR